MEYSEQGLNKYGYNEAKKAREQGMAKAQLTADYGPGKSCLTTYSNSHFGPTSAQLDHFRNSRPLGGATSLRSARSQASKIARDCHNENCCTTYHALAWCDRTFIAQFEVEAENPEAALMKAQEDVHDAPAEECDNGYKWDTFLINDAAGNPVASKSPELVTLAEHIHNKQEIGELATALSDVLLQPMVFNLDSAGRGREWLRNARAIVKKHREVISPGRIAEPEG